jgi:ABC-type sugar transport system ATPase subunit
MFDMLGNVVKNLFSKPATRMFPAERRDSFKGTRGCLGINIESCIFCGICARKCPSDAIAQGISFVTEDRKRQWLVLGRSIGENMSFPLLKQFSRMVLMNRTMEKESWKEQMERLKIKAPGFNTLAGDLSGGNQQKVVLGRWLLTKPKILLMDEPTRGIDVGAKAEIYNLINQLAAEGMGILIISSELPELLGLSDRIITFCEGRVTGEFTKEEATQEKLLTAATLREAVKTNAG